MRNKTYYNDDEEEEEEDTEEEEEEDEESMDPWLSSLETMTITELKEKNKQILESYGINPVDPILSKLSFYHYVDEIDQVKIGSYVRYIPIQNPVLKTGGIVCDIKINNTGTTLLCKCNHPSRNRVFQIRFSDHIVFQKCSQNEKNILSLNEFVYKMG